jgi:nucleotide-binding universal stress UspA family protein
MHFAEKTGAAVDIAHAFEVSSFFKSDFLVIPTGGGNALPVREAVRLQAQEHLDQLLANCHARGHFPRASHLLAGSPADAISSFAGEKGYDLVIMGTRGHGGAAKLLLGSVAQRVIEHAPCPVITIVGGHGTRSLEKILVASDFSEHANAALR